jgi:hypothetical protein|tara:strand:+ start:1885 stop:1995 length:111 start_codon:yes stop_codon:yes gene_type:complete
MRLKMQGASPKALENAIAERLAERFEEIEKAQQHIL